MHRTAIDGCLWARLQSPLSTPPAQGQVLFVRLYDAEGSDLAVGQHKDAASRVQALSQVSGPLIHSHSLTLTLTHTKFYFIFQALVDIPTVVNSMPPAIRLAVVQSRN